MFTATKFAAEAAFASEAFPCNPRPFINRLKELVDEEGSDALQGDRAKAVLWILNAMAYGQLASIDLCDEWSRLHSELSIVETN